jgi:hypothetical protein
MRKFAALLALACVSCSWSDDEPDVIVLPDISDEPASSPVNVRSDPAPDCVLYMQPIRFPDGTIVTVPVACSDEALPFDPPEVLEHPFTCDENVARLGPVLDNIAEAMNAPGNRSR